MLFLAPLELYKSKWLSVGLYPFTFVSKDIWSSQISYLYDKKISDDDDEDDDNDDENDNSHNSFNFQARTSGFSIVVDLDST